MVPSYRRRTAEFIIAAARQGAARFGGGTRGDLYVRLQAHVPERLSDRQRRLLTKDIGAQQAKAKT